MFELKRKKLVFAGFIKKAAAGVLIGVAAIMPGISGGAIAATYGMYEHIISALVNIRKNFKQSAAYLLPLALGAAFGVLLFGIILKSLISYARNELLFLFAGLIAGSIPGLVNDANKKGFKKRYLISFFISFIIVLGCEYVLPFTTNIENPNLGAANGILSGAVISAGTVIPGISSSVVLIKLGLYEKLLSALTEFNFSVCFFVALGFLVTSLFLVKLVDFTFHRFHGYANYSVLGFLAATIIIIFPKSSLVSLDVFLLVSGAIASFLVSKIRRAA